MNSYTCLLIDDELEIAELIEMDLKRLNIRCTITDSMEQAKNLLKERKFNLCLTDMSLSGKTDRSGLDIVQYIQQYYPETPVAVITAYGCVETAVQALKNGAFDFLNKPIEYPRLRNLVQSALKLTKTREEALNNLVGESEQITQLRTKLQKFARTQTPVHIYGESGVGKEVVARLIHTLGPRSEKAFVPVNCGALSAELMESEFFGYKKGSFTGAAADKEGLFKAAQGGTLFLDEIGELPLILQVKLLRAIQEQRIRPIGSQKEEEIDVRILSATNKNLSELVANNLFRADLFYRINVLNLYIPPLRERKEDIPLLVNKMLKDYEKEYNAPLYSIESEALILLKNYTFQGNIRELKNIIERAIALSDDNTIRVSDIQLPNNETLLSGKSNKNAEPEKTEMNVPIPSNPKVQSLLPELDTSLIGIEKLLIMQAIEKANGNKTQAAKLLGIGFGALRYRMEKLGMNND